MNERVDLMIWWDERIRTETEQKEWKLEIVLIIIDNNNLYWEKEIAQRLFIQCKR